MRKMLVRSSDARLSGPDISRSDQFIHLHRVHMADSIHSSANRPMVTSSRDLLLKTKNLILPYSAALQRRLVSQQCPNQKTHVGGELLQGAVGADAMLRAQLLPKLAPDCQRDRVRRQTSGTGYQASGIRHQAWHVVRDKGTKRQKRTKLGAGGSEMVHPAPASTYLCAPTKPAAPRGSHRMATNRRATPWDWWIRSKQKTLRLPAQASV